MQMFLDHGDTDVHMTYKYILSKLRSTIVLHVKALFSSYSDLCISPKNRIFFISVQ